MIARALLGIVAKVFCVVSGFLWVVARALLGDCKGG